MSRGHRPRKRFGQHFLADPRVIDDIVAAIGATADETLVEIGPGQGAITMPLLDSGATMHAIELDRDLAAMLDRRLANANRFILHQADALEFDLRAIGSDLRVVGNLPYNISTPLIFHLLDSLDAIRDMHFMLQKEVVERMAAEPGSRRYGRLTVMLGCRATVEKLFDVPPEAFSPPPEVWSSVIRILPRREKAFGIEDPAALEAIVKRAFSQRRKTLRNALRNAVDCELLEAAGIDPSARAETVPVRNWVDLANRVADVH
ncbi:MAG: 16S rRNA (adenine(1518)-N(6)/adenine(1519)-N(6))-dimethyltransferase RsmA [Woeseiaceae bacterium]|nr:16S rRNA (adenine(1518)-N(6)/adenine(1519)-N(6))-dimethyltransferase RsmA [Woeseiaceae bacterium]